MLDKLAMTDSFLRECGRVSPIGNLASGRMSLVDFKFKDGTVIPKGYIVSGSIPVLHETLPGSQPDFDGFRYSNLAEKGQKQPQMVSTSRDYLAFGEYLTLPIRCGGNANDSVRRIRPTCVSSSCLQAA